MVEDVAVDAHVEHEHGHISALPGEHHFRGGVVDSDDRRNTRKRLGCTATSNSISGLQASRVPPVSESCTKKQVVTLWPVHQHTNQNCHGCEGPKNLHQKWQDRDAAAVPPTHRHIQKNIADANGPKMQIDDKSVLCSQPACLCPNSCDNGDARQMRMTDKDTKHAPTDEHRASSNEKELCSRITTRDLICFHRVRTTRCVSSVPFHGVRHFSLWSQITFVRLTPVPLRQSVDNHPLVRYPSAPRPQCLRAPSNHT